MSNYKRLTLNPSTQEWEMATWIDDYYGSHRYGVEFPDGDIYDPSKIELETKEE